MDEFQSERKPTTIIFLGGKTMDTSTMRKITSQLEHLAGQKLAKEINKAQSYHDGYVQACEDLWKNRFHI